MVVNLRNTSSRSKHLYLDGQRLEVDQVNGYLTAAPSAYLHRRTTPLSNIPKMQFGMMVYNGGNLMFDQREIAELVESDPEASTFTKQFIGSSEFINGIDRYAVWFTPDKVEEAKKFNGIARKIEATRVYRTERGTKDASKLSAVPWRFREQHPPTDSIIVPSLSSERREYVPIGFLGPDTVISNLACAIYDTEPWLFTLLTSKIHMA